MSLLLDTHALIWAVTAPARFRASTLETLEAADRILISPVSAYELAFKLTLGKLPIAERLLRDLPVHLAALRCDVLPITLEHAEAAGRLPLLHRDPFDRMLAAQALVDDLTIVSVDGELDQFGVRRLW